MTAYLHPDKQVSVRRVLVRSKTRKAVRPKKAKAAAKKPRGTPAPSSGLVSALAAEMLARRRGGGY